jgi:antitoxin (DNA-binding transcriptional repressor) of toxin-antitoxin stability system
MNTITVEEFRAHVDKYLADAASKDVVLTNEGKPWLVLRAVTREDRGTGSDSEQSPAFWEMIRTRREEKGISWEEAKKELELD